MDEGALKRIGVVLGGVVACGFGLYEGFCGLVQGRLSLVSEGTPALGSATHDVEFTGGSARALGAAFLLMAGVVVFATVRSIRESSR